MVFFRRFFYFAKKQKQKTYDSDWEFVLEKITHDNGAVPPREWASQNITIDLELPLKNMLKRKDLAYVSINYDPLHDDRTKGRYWQKIGGTNFWNEVKNLNITSGYEIYYYVYCVKYFPPEWFDSLFDIIQEELNIWFECHERLLGIALYTKGKKQLKFFLINI